MDTGSSTDQGVAVKVAYEADGRIRGRKEPVRVPDDAPHIIDDMEEGGDQDGQPDLREVMQERLRHVWEMLERGAEGSLDGVIAHGAAHLASCFYGTKGRKKHVLHLTAPVILAAGPEDADHMRGMLNEANVAEPGLFVFSVDHSMAQWPYPEWPYRDILDGLGEGGLRVMMTSRLISALIAGSARALDDAERALMAERQRFSGLAAQVGLARNVNTELMVGALRAELREAKDEVARLRKERLDAGHPPLDTSGPAFHDAAPSVGEINEYLKEEIGALRKRLAAAEEPLDQALEAEKHEVARLRTLLARAESQIRHREKKARQWEIRFRWAAATAVLVACFAAGLMISILG